MIPAPRFLIFTDLDGSLLDASTYSFEAARGALDELGRRGAAIVPCTSKTGAETRHFMTLLGIQTPYIVESGGGIFIPESCFAAMPPVGETVAHGQLVRIAVGYREVLEGMSEIKERLGGGIVGFNDLSPAVIAEETGLPLDLARLAKEREFDEPFRFIGREPGWQSKCEAIVSRRGLRISRGGRYWHLHGDTDKGRAVGLVKSYYQAERGPIATVGVGDSAMDLPMLEFVDVAVVIPQPRAGHDPSLLRGLRTPILASSPGPEGWGPAILRAVAKLLEHQGGFWV